MDNTTLLSGVLFRQTSCNDSSSNEAGTALLLVLIGLSIFSVLALYMTLNATTDLRISDNYESHIKATYAARAGLNHARALLRGLDFDDLLKGPDGAYNSDPSYRAQAVSFGFRNPLPWSIASYLDIYNPINDVAGIPDDGLVSTGFDGGSNGTLLIPPIGIAQVAPNPYGQGMITTSRYFVKVTDNNGQASEIAGDPTRSPFIDGDGIVVVRSMGIARTIPEITESAVRRNSISVFEGQFKRLSSFKLKAALVIQGPEITASFGNNSLEISGDLLPGIGVIDTNMDDNQQPDEQIRKAAAGQVKITGAGLSSPSIRNITGSMISDQDTALLLDPRYLWNFINEQGQDFADSVYTGDQNWSGNAPSLGFYDSTKPYNAPGQDPKVTVVKGNLNVNDVTGAGLLIVTGGFSYSGSFAFNGLILVIGSGVLNADGSGEGITGGLFLSSLENNGVSVAFGKPAVSISGSSRITANSSAVKMAINLIPPSQISFREITSSMDP
jgi:hypothetical protein